MPASRPIYLDAHATTPVDPRVVDAMLPFLRDEYGNASSRNHAYGWEAEEAVERARDRVAETIGASPKEIVWTSGATESDNLALFGVAEAARAAGSGDGVVIGATEHPAVLDPARRLERRGFRVTRVGVDGEGFVDPDALRRVLDDRTILVSLMLANNEVGTIQDVATLAGVVKSACPAAFHTDAAQAIGKIPVDVGSLGVDLLSMSAHKIHGPKGVGALWVRRRPRVRLEPILSGGGQERGLRSGTLNVPGIVGMGEALEIAAAELPDERTRLATLRDRLLALVREALEEVHVNGPLGERRLPNNLNVSFTAVEAEDLLREIPEVAVSTGAACSSASLDPSHVLSELGLGEARAQSSIRFGLHRFTTEEEIDRAADAVIRGVSRLRSSSPVWAARPPRASG
jgi:cysteine desulfurase